VPVLLVEQDSEYLGGSTQALAPIRFEAGGRSHELSLDHGQHCLWTQYHDMRALLRRYHLFGNLISCDATQYVVDDGAEVRRLPPFDVSPLRPHPTLAHFLVHLFQATHATGLSPKDYARLLRAMPKLSTAFAFRPPTRFSSAKAWAPWLVRSPEAPSPLQRLARKGRATLSGWSDLVSTPSNGMPLATGRAVM
jgi:hypothetical protein